MTIQDEVKQLVADYIRDNPKEFRDFKTAQRIKYEGLVDQEFAELKGEHGLKRALFEYPETLYNILFRELSEEGWDYLNTKQGAQWFARTFPVFKVGDKI